MQSISFKDPVTGDSFSSNTYEVRRNGAGNVLRAKAPSGATAVKMQTTFDGVDDAPTNQFADDITQDELENFAEDMQESMDIATNPPGSFSRGIGRITSVAGGLGPGSWQALRLPSVGFGKRAGLISKFAFQFFKIISICFLKFLLNICKINHITIFKFVERTVHSRQGL